MSIKCEFCEGVDGSVVQECLGEVNPEARVMEEHKNALLGWAASTFGGEPVAVYSAETVIDNLVDRDGMSYEEAREFFEFNIAGAYVGENTPLFLYRPV